MTEPAQLALDFGHQAAFGHEEFLTADSNREASSLLANWPHWPAPTAVLYGPEGCGKTHLLSIWQRRTGAVVLRPDDLPALDPPAVIAASRAVAIDDVDQAFSHGSGGPGALLHLYNLVHEARGWLLLTGQTPPSVWDARPPDLASRLRAAVAIAIREPDDSLLAAVLVKQFADRKLKVSPDIIRLLSTQIERSFAAARAVVVDLDNASLAQKKRISRTLVASVLAARNSPKTPAPTS